MFTVSKKRDEHRGLIATPRGLAGTPCTLAPGDGTRSCTEPARARLDRRPPKARVAIGVVPGGVMKGPVLGRVSRVDVGAVQLDGTKNNKHFAERWCAQGQVAHGSTRRPASATRYRGDRRAPCRRGARLSSSPSTSTLLTRHRRRHSERGERVPAPPSTRAERCRPDRHGT